MQRSKIQKYGHVYIICTMPFKLSTQMNFILSSQVIGQKQYKFPICSSTIFWNCSYFFVLFPTRYVMCRKVNSLKQETYIAVFLSGFFSNEHNKQYRNMFYHLLTANPIVYFPFGFLENSIYCIIQQRAATSDWKFLSFTFLLPSSLFVNFFQHSRSMYLYDI